MINLTNEQISKLRFPKVFKGINCKICGGSVNNKKNGFSNLLDNSETKKLLKMKKKDVICIDCKFTMMAVDIVTPFYAN